MSSIALTPNASGTGTLTLAAPNTNTARTLTLPDATTTLVGTDATQTLSNKTIAASQLTGALPAIDGSALTGIASMTLLGTIATTSGLTQTLSGLSLTNYKQIYVSFTNISTSTTASTNISIGGLAVLTNITNPSFLTSGNAFLDLTGSGYGFTYWFPAQVAHTTTTASTSISVVSSASPFDGGTVRIYGVK